MAISGQRITADLNRTALDALLRKALHLAGDELGLTVTQTAEVIGKTRSLFDKGREAKPIDSHTRQMIALVLRVHRALSAIVGDERSQMRHWLHTPNRHTGGTPSEQLRNPEQLVGVLQYLDAMRGSP